MSKLTDRISYLKGLAAGMKINTEKDANKLMLEMLGVMGEMAEEMQAMADAHNDLNEYVESIDDDLSDLEETLFGDEEMHDEDCDCEECAHEHEEKAPEMLNTPKPLYLNNPRDCTDEEFMALFEQYPAFDNLDDAFIEDEENITARIACYVDDHLNDFVEIQ